MELTDDLIGLYMERCIELGKMCRGIVGTPYVGSLVVSCSGSIVGEGYKKFLDNTSYLLHSERAALDAAGEFAEGNTLFTTLEPCKRAKGARLKAFISCSELIVERGIKRVVFGLDESNSPHGNGSQYLERHEIEIIKYNKLNPIIIGELMPYRRSAV